MLLFQGTYSLLNILLKCIILVPMAKKKKKNRRIIALECTETGMRCYVSQKNIINSPDKLQLMKFNPKLRKYTLHKEIQKLK